jgi:hypothetical protein
MMARLQPVRLGYPELVILGSPGVPDGQRLLRTEPDPPDQPVQYAAALRSPARRGCCPCRRPRLGLGCSSEVSGDAMTVGDTPWEPPLAGTELEHLVGSLDRLRTTFRWKADDLDGAGLQSRFGSSSLTLGGLLKHLGRRRARPARSRVRPRRPPCQPASAPVRPDRGVRPAHGARRPAPRGYRRAGR